MQRCTAFAGKKLVAAGTLPDVAADVRPLVQPGSAQTVLIFDDATGAVIDVDFRGTAAEVRARVAKAVVPESQAPAPQGPGRPKLGVVAREVTLLPRHWDWLKMQPGGASVTLRKLIDEARRGSGTKDQRRQSQEAAYRFMSAMLGNEAGFEEAARALFRGDAERFQALTDPWPVSFRNYARKLAAPALAVAA